MVCWSTTQISAPGVESQEDQEIKVTSEYKRARPAGIVGLYLKWTGIKGGKEEEVLFVIFGYNMYPVRGNIYTWILNIIILSLSSTSHPSPFWYEILFSCTIPCSYTRDVFAKRPHKNVSEKLWVAFDLSTSHEKIRETCFSGCGEWVPWIVPNSATFHTVGNPGQNVVIPGRQVGL